MQRVGAHGKWLAAEDKARIAAPRDDHRPSVPAACPSVETCQEAGVAADCPDVAACEAAAGVAGTRAL